MTCALCKTWAAAVVCFAAVASTSDGIELPENGERFEYREESPSAQANYGNAIGESGHSSRSYEVAKIVRPVSYTYFSGDLRGVFNARTTAKLPVGFRRQKLQEPPFGVEAESEEGEVSPSPRETSPVLDDNIRQQSYLAPYQEASGTLPPVSRRKVKFPLNTVLPANSLSFDHNPYPGLLRAVNTFSDLTPSRKPKEGVLVTHNAVSLPSASEGMTTASRTRITNHGTHGDGASYPYREFTETTQNTQGDKGNLIERIQRLRVHQDLDENPAQTLPSSKTGKGGSATRYESEQGESKEDDHHTTKSRKGEKGYKKDHKHHREAKGYHDKERDSSNSDENLKKENKFHKGEEFYGEQRKTEKGGNGKKYGEGGKHKKGHTTHGEHNIIKKDEFIKNTKFYDENHDGGEHEEHGELYGQHEEKKGRNEEGEKKESNYVKKEEEKKKSHDKGHDEEKHRGHDKASGQEEHFQQEEEYGGNKGGHTFKKWGKAIGDHH